jgi:Zn-dependent protease with chaperone function
LALAAGVALVATSPHAVRGWLGGPLLLLLAWYLRPRVTPGWDKHARWITAEQAPELFRLLDALADLMGADRFLGVTLRPMDTAGVLTFGLRRRRVLLIGVPLWEVLAPQERLAVLAHEVAHSVNYDAEIGHAVSGALHTLRRWYALTHPLTLVTRNSRLRTSSVLDFVLPIGLIHAGAVAMLRRSKPRAEYLADHLAASVASTDAVCSAFTRFPTSRAATAVLAAALRARVPSHPWRMVRDYAAALPEHERRRLALIEEREGMGVDSTHPPTHLRLRMLRERPALPARLTLGEEWSAAIDAELAPHAEALAARLTKFARR